MKHNKEDFDFGGFATKFGIRCTDGRTIQHGAFQSSDGVTVPLVWQHLRNEPSNILGHALLEHREDGVYAYCSLNESDSATNAKLAIEHEDIKALSIFANNIVQHAAVVVNGIIKEVSLVISGANSGAFIDNLSFSHGDGTSSVDDTEAFISSMTALDLAEDLEHADSDLTIGAVLETLTDVQKNVVYELIGQAIESVDAEHSDSTTGITHTDGEEDTLGSLFDGFTENQKSAVYILIAEAVKSAETNKQKNLAHSNENEGDSSMKKNIFTAEDNTGGQKRVTLTHSDMETIKANAQRFGSFKAAVIEHAGTYGINNIDFLFPEAVSTNNNGPVFVKRQTEWVKEVFGAAHHSPFSRIKTVVADITPDQARAKGYTKGNLKVDEVIALLKRVTTPTTVYKKQKLDRDDMIDITDMNIVAWLKGEMRLMLDEELARAALVGDGRSAALDDKIDETSIRPIYTDDPLYSVKVLVTNTTTTSQLIDEIVLARKDYQGSGNPVFFSTPAVVGDMLLLKDTTGRRIYNTINDLAAALRVKKVVEVPVMEGIQRVISGTNGADLLGIIVNMNDYYFGADKGGQVNMFDDFDIDYNQYKYLIETRASGALVTPHSAIVMERAVVIP